MREGPRVTVKEEPKPEIKQIAGGKRKKGRDPGSYIGQKPSEKDTGDEDIDEPIEDRNIRFYMPPNGTIFDSVTLGITIKAGNKKYQQLIENLPLLEVEE